MHETVSPENQEILARQVSAFPACKLEMINVTPYFDGLDFANKKYSRAAYYRFVLPWIMQVYPFVIYLDCDVVCLVDIAEMLDYDLSDCALAAARHMTGSANWNLVIHLSKGLGLENPRDYFNSGVLVFNTKRFREKADLQALCRMAAENYFMCCDQDVLNIVFKGDIFYLPVKWNLSVTDEDYIDLSEDEKYEYPEARENPAILHFYADKPLEAREEGEEEQTERHKLFWDYASRTPFYESLQNKLAANKEKRRAGETIDPEREDCVLFSNNKIEAKSAEVALEKHGIAYKIKYGDADSAYKFFVANEDVEQALDVLMSAL